MESHNSASSRGGRCPRFPVSLSIEAVRWAFMIPIPRLTPHLYFTKTPPMPELKIAHLWSLLALSCGELCKNVARWVVTITG